MKPTKSNYIYDIINCNDYNKSNHYSELNLNTITKLVTKLDNNLSYDEVNHIADLSDVRCTDGDTSIKMIKVIDKAKKNGDSVGGIIEVRCSGLPYGLGSYTQWDKKLQSKISETILSINVLILKG